MISRAYPKSASLRAQLNLGLKKIRQNGIYQKILAKVPLAELNRYSTALSSITSGRATYNMKFAEYSQVPTDIQEKLLKAYEDQEKEEE